MKLKRKREIPAVCRLPLVERGCGGVWHRRKRESTERQGAHTQPSVVIQKKNVKKKTEGQVWFSFLRDHHLPASPGAREQK